MDESALKQKFNDIRVKLRELAAEVFKEHGEVPPTGFVLTEQQPIQIPLSTMSGDPGVHVQILDAAQKQASAFASLRLCESWMGLQDDETPGVAAEPREVLTIFWKFQDKSGTDYALIVRDAQPPRLETWTELGEL